LVLQFWVELPLFTDVVFRLPPPPLLMPTSLVWKSS
jgi:hypothetical protein